MDHHASAVVAQVEQWIEQCVVGLSLCPFATGPFRAGKVHIEVCTSDQEMDYLAQIDTGLEALADPLSQVETTLIVAPNTLCNFLDFNDFLGEVENLLARDDRSAGFQMANFHPQYQFAGVDPDDAGNYTNRAPYPVVQWLRADTVAKAIDNTDTLAIPDANIARLQALGIDECRRLFPWAG